LRASRVTLIDFRLDPVPLPSGAAADWWVVALPSLDFAATPALQPSNKTIECLAHIHLTVFEEK
jgi:hypothetical protein